jgi:hypothetical protein
VFVKGALQGRKPPASGLTLDGFNGGTLAVRGQGDASEARLPIYQHRTGAAFAAVTALLGAGQSLSFAQKVDQEEVIPNHVLNRAAVDAQADDSLHAGGLSVRRGVK